MRFGLAFLSSVSIRRRLSYLPKLFLALYLFLVLCFVSTHSLEAEEKKGLGLIPLTQEHLDHIENNWPKVVQVKPNKIGAKRIEEHLNKQGKPFRNVFVATSIEEEIITDRTFNKNESFKHQLRANDTLPLPRYVNNTTRPSFPPIGDQGNQGSCVAWASTYYQATHEIGLLNGYNNKTSNEHILSPKWTYNILNNGEDGGLIILDAYSLLSKNGAASLANLPYDGDYLAWDMNPHDWVAAISNRTTEANTVKGLGGSDPQNLQVIKQLLNNGHVLTIGTYVSSWVFTKVKKDPANPNDPFVGQAAVSWMDGSDGGHCMTIVGYNDDIWIDINNNGKIDKGEKGAFLIANSWGSNWGNNGLIWVSYDAFLAVSAVPGGPKDGRVALADAMNSLAVNVVPKAANYQPSLIAQFTLTQSARDEIALSAGLSDTTTTTPEQRFFSGALVYQGGNYRFDGTVADAPEPGTFALDLTDLVSTVEGANALKRFYLLLRDSGAQNPTTLTSFSLIDTIHNKQLTHNKTPITFADQFVQPYIEYNFYDQSPLDNVPPVVNITSPTSGKVLGGAVEVVVNATDDVGVDRVELYIDSVLYATDTTSPYLFTIDSTQLSDGDHLISAVAYDVSNNAARSDISITVDNSAIKTELFINAGGDDITFQGVKWKKDNGFTKSGVTSSKLNFANPVYNTERIGNFSYNLPVKNGSYKVTLKFAETVHKKSKKRVFGVRLNGKMVIPKLDLYKAAGFGKPYDLTFPVNVTNQNINIDFISIVNAAKVNAIQIVQQ